MIERIVIFAITDKVIKTVIILSALIKYTSIKLEYDYGTVNTA